MLSFSSFLLEDADWTDRWYVASHDLFLFNYSSNISLSVLSFLSVCNLMTETYSPYISKIIIFHCSTFWGLQKQRYSGFRGFPCVLEFWQNQDRFGQQAGITWLIKCGTLLMALSKWLFCKPTLLYSHEELMKTSALKVNDQSLSAPFRLAMDNTECR